MQTYKDASFRILAYYKDIPDGVSEGVKSWWRWPPFPALRSYQGMKSIIVTQLDSVDGK